MKRKKPGSIAPAADFVRGRITCGRVTAQAGVNSGGNGRLCRSDDMRQTPWGEHGNGFLPQKDCGSSIPHRFGSGRDNEPAFCRTRKRRVRQRQHPGKNRGQEVNGRKHEYFFLSKLRARTSDPRHRVTGLKPTFPSLYERAGNARSEPIERKSHRRPGRQKIFTKPAGSQRLAATTCGSIGSTKRGCRLG